MASEALLCGITLAFLVAVSVSASVIRCISCPCGSSSQNYTHCIDESLLEEQTCEWWSQCETCEGNTTACKTCPPNQFGPGCSETRPIVYFPSLLPNGDPERKKKDDPDLQNSAERYDNCPFLDRPEFGSIRCNIREYERSCTSRCLPGYHFEGRENVHELTLQCKRGVWTPERKFPQCKPDGSCELEMRGPGNYNCTVDIQGTHCGIICDGRFRGVFHCYPGRQWYPPLPHCIAAKSSKPCRCQSGGVCDDNGNCICLEGRTGPYCEKRVCRCRSGGVCDGEGKCICPEGRTGTYCERRACSCPNGRVCDSEGNCVCPEGRTGNYCDRQVSRERAICPDPGIPQDGSRLHPDGSDASEKRGFQAGESVIFSCDGEGSALQGKSFITCLGDGTWSAPAPKCINSPADSIRHCSDPGTILYGSRVNADGSSLRPSTRYRYGQSIIYFCHAEYELVGNSRITCLQSGQWSSAKPFCQPIARPIEEREPLSAAACRHPGVDMNGIIEDHPLLDPRRRGQSFPPGTELSFSCKEGFETQEATILFCLASGEWSSAPPTCRKVADATDKDIKLCPRPEVDPNVEVEEFLDLDERKEQTFVPGVQLTFRCREGYVLEGASRIHCLLSGEWSDPSPRCKPEEDDPVSEPLVCSTPELGPNLEVEEFLLDPRKLKPLFDPGTELTIRCKKGYILEGSGTIRCNSYGRWSAPSTKCVKKPVSNSGSTSTVYCLNPKSILDGWVEVIGPYDNPNEPSAVDVEDHFPLGTQLKFRCNKGSILNGKDIITCESNGYWSGSKPECYTSE